MQDTFKNENKQLADKNLKKGNLFISFPLIQWKKDKKERNKKHINN